MLYKYYLKARGPSPGAQPSGFVAMEDYGVRKTCRKKCFGYEKFFDDVYFKAWGYVYYEEKLTQKQIDDYELVYGGVVNVNSN